MKRLMAATLAAALLALAPAGTAAAYVVEVTTSIPLQGVTDESALATAIRSAVDDALARAIGFQPTLVALTTAVVIGDRLYVRLLVADQEGEETLDELQRAPSPEDDRPTI